MEVEEGQMLTEGVFFHLDMPDQYIHDAPVRQPVRKESGVPTNLEYGPCLWEGMSDYIKKGVEI